VAASKKLSTYQAKADFTKTREPSGETSIVATDRRRFVIQKHAATRLHYDLRLELEGVFKSWAVRRGPSLDPADKRLAVEVEDYGDFEGTIPKANTAAARSNSGTAATGNRTATGHPKRPSPAAISSLCSTVSASTVAGSWFA
jgi:DNA ligase D-like protein (predicted 3'-phosphoesterase)